MRWCVSGPASRFVVAVAAVLWLAADSPGQVVAHRDDDGACGHRPAAGCPAGAGGAARSAAGWTPGAELSRRVREAVALRWGVDPDRVRLEWGAVREAQPIGENAAFDLVGTGAGGSWIVAFASGEPGAAPIRVRLRAGTEVDEPVAARDLERDVVLAAGDIAWTSVIRWGPPAGAAPEVRPGWVTRRRIAAGDALREPAVGPPLAVRAGETVEAVWSRGGITLTLPVRAAGSAVVGERVAVRTESGRRIQAIAVEPGRVRIDAPSEGNP